MTQEEIKDVLEKHQHWLNEDVDGWENMRADLRDANLRCADLIDANLRCADLRDADLRCADLIDANLRCADLRCADLIDANLIDANLRDADLRCADLIDANLRCADLRCADLRGANLIDANLRCADLRGANLRGADLRDADLIDADLRDADLRDANLIDAKNVPFIPYACPDTGSFIGYKKANQHIVELEILSDARRCSATGRKCRCDKAKVLSITELDGSNCDLTEVESDYNHDFMYKVGEIVEEPNFCENRWNECSEGIHFFINRQEAVNY